MGKSQKEGVYLTIELPQGGYISFSNAVEYRVNKGRWISLNAGATTVRAPTSGVYNPFEFRAKLTPAQDVGVGTFTIYNASSAYLSGNCMSLLFGDEAAEHTSLVGYDYAFCKLFADVSVNLMVIDYILPAETLSTSCYEYMFENSGISWFPRECLPALNLAQHCYYGMFKNCVNLSGSMAYLDADVLYRGCYGEMYYGCTSLTGTGNLSAGTLADFCYFAMFEGCTSLTRTYSIGGSYGFGEQSCSHMYYGCTGLTTAAGIYTDSMGASACWNMFRNCTNLTSMGGLQCNYLENDCYSYMFAGCTSLTTAPVLTASTLKAYCYEGMFYGCSSLNSIKMLATSVSATDCLKNWVYGVSSSGTFIKHPNASLPTGVSGIPNGWTVQTATS